MQNIGLKQPPLSYDQMRQQLSEFNARLANPRLPPIVTDPVERSNDAVLMAGMASGGQIGDGYVPPYETSPVQIAKDNPVKSVVSLGLAPLIGAAAGNVGNVVDAMFTPTAPGHEMDMVRGKAADVASDLSSTAKNVAIPAAAAVQAVTGRPLSLGIDTTPKPAPNMLPSHTGESVLNQPSVLTAAAPTGFVLADRADRKGQKLGLDEGIDYYKYKNMNGTVDAGTTGGLVQLGGGNVNPMNPESMKTLNSKLVGAPAYIPGQEAKTAANIKALQSGSQSAIDAAARSSRDEYQIQRQNSPEGQITQLNNVIAQNLGNQYDGPQKVAAAQAQINAIQHQQKLDLARSSQETWLAGEKLGADVKLSDQKFKANEHRLDLQHEASQNQLYKPDKSEIARIKSEADRTERLLTARATLMSKPEWATLTDEQKALQLSLLQYDPETQTFIPGSPEELPKKGFLGIGNKPGKPATPGKIVPVLKASQRGEVAAAQSLLKKYGGDRAKAEAAYKKGERS
jgi:hypothetical protein